MSNFQGIRAILRLMAATALYSVVAFTASAQTVRYVHTDGLGSVVLVTDNNRNIVERSEYEPYGNLLNHPISDGPGYTGHVNDAATGLNYMQQRYYDPQIGKFLSVDPVTPYSKPGKNFNRYNYAANNPYLFVDPDGRYECTRKGGTCNVHDAKIAESYVSTAQRSYQKMAEGAAKDRLGKILGMVGTANDGNGFSINLTNLSDDHLGELTAKGMDLDPSQISAVASGLNISAKMLAAGIIGHEGSHKLDSMQPGFNRNFYPATGLERMLTELRAYGMTSAIGNVLRINNGVNIPGMSLQEREQRIWESAKQSWESACNGKQSSSCSGYKP
ncbi:MULTISPECIES: RHS repeat-associated core domain-containing protein [Xanthomonas]|uniref:Teneurin-like YD-shell domain-containing protein n=1 Tax=Xanthomonas sacchari TaxID=56458 RepID=A0AA46SUJ4_9XANT|nr:MULTISPECIES: RHS repeat-associated core domain-containing protein [Xanthomonas]KAB7770986.1 hypothetical protein CEK68_01845 [Xanthomonas sp. LMG 12461]MCW0366790.1 hypothetical protein [Xanthomonas sacchari]MCW0441299.1 hypothetical protein [Xanthomonas sacchari]UYK80677.1 hypothetical protein NG829_20485 [Xanthomonas sacchari]UYK88810.1 hypothetical protein NG824_20495 [Xanthomonas sacchari]